MVTAGRLVAAVGAAAGGLALVWAGTSPATAVPEWAAAAGGTLAVVAVCRLGYAAVRWVAGRLGGRPVRRGARLVGWVAAGGFAVAVLGWNGFLLAVVGVRTFPLLLAAEVAAAGWVVYAYLRYRQARQDEVAQVVAAAVAARLPLVPALQTYLRERPRQPGWNVLLMVAAVLLTAVLPGFVVLWLWAWQRRPDRRVADLIDHLGEGVPLSAALKQARGVVSAEAQLAAAVGEATGRMDPLLAVAGRERAATAVLAAAPRVLYPLAVVWAVVAVQTFLSVAIVPKFKKIFNEFGLKLPAPTAALIGYWDWVTTYVLPVASPAALAGVVAAVAAADSPTVRWYFPLVGRLYRWDIQGKVLRLLGPLLAAGRPAPAALRLLAADGDFPAVAARRLEAAAAHLDRGEPLADGLRKAGLLPRAMAPLVTAAERAGTLTWALGELGEHQSGRAVRAIRRWSAVAGPVAVAAVGVLVGFVVVAMFVPLVKLIEASSK